PTARLSSSWPPCSRSWALRQAPKGRPALWRKHRSKTRLFSFGASLRAFPQFAALLSEECGNDTNPISHRPPIGGSLQRAPRHDLALGGGGDSPAACSGSTGDDPLASG